MSITARSGLAPAHHADQRRRVPGPAHHLVPRHGEQAGQPFPEQRRVLADHDPHGSTASITVPPPDGLRMVSEPPRAATRSLRPARPDPGRTAAPPHPSSSTRIRTAVVVPVHPHGHRPGVGVLGRVGHRLAGHVVRGRGQVVRQRRRVDVQPDRDRQRPGQPGQGGVQPVVQAGRPQPVRDLPQLGDRGGQLGHRPVQHAVHIDRPGPYCICAIRNAMPSDDQPLLRAVVQVPFQADPFGVAGLHDPGPAVPHLAQRGGQFGPQPDHLDQVRAERRDRPAAPRVRSPDQSTPICSPASITGTYAAGADRLRSRPPGCACRAPGRRRAGRGRAARPAASLPVPPAAPARRGCGLAGRRSRPGRPAAADRTGRRRTGPAGGAVALSTIAQAAVATAATAAESRPSSSPAVTADAREDADQRDGDDRVRDARGEHPVHVVQIVAQHADGQRDREQHQRGHPDDDRDDPGAGRSG